MTKFAVGRRWRLKPEFVKERTQRGDKDRTFDFVIIGPPEMDFNSPKTNKRCRLEVPEGGHSPNSGGRCWNGCSNGLEQDYSHAHLKKYAYLVEEK